MTFILKKFVPKARNFFRSRTEKSEQEKIVSKCSFMSFVAFPLLVSSLYVLSIKQTGANGDCPVAIDLNGNGRIDITGHTPTRDKLYTLFSARHFVEFDVFGDGELQKIDWIKANTDGLIVEWDLDNPKSSIMGLDLMGLERIFPDGTIEQYDTGYQKLASYDTNRNGSIDELDDANLAVWIDDGDAVLQDGEIFSFQQLDIKAINVIGFVQAGAYGFEAYTSVAHKNDGSILYTEDIWFLNRRDVEETDQRVASVLAFGR